MKKPVEFLSPSGLMQSPVFSQLVVTQGPGKTIRVGGQNAVNEEGELIGKGDLALQTEQAMRNIQAALESAGATFENLVKLTIYIINRKELHSGFMAAQKFLGQMEPPPVISVIILAGLVNPEFLIEIEAEAFLAA